MTEDEYRDRINNPGQHCDPLKRLQERADYSTNPLKHIQRREELSSNPTELFNEQQYRWGNPWEDPFKVGRR